MEVPRKYLIVMNHRLFLHHPLVLTSAYHAAMGQNSGCLSLRLLKTFESCEGGCAFSAAFVENMEVPLTALTRKAFERNGAEG